MKTDTTPTGPPLNVLVVDDEKNIRSVLVVCLESAHCRVVEAASVAQAESALERTPFDLVFLDLRIGSENGLDFLPRLLQRSPGSDVVVITAYATINTAVDAIARGARDYLPKPFTPEQIRQMVDRVRTRRELEREVVSLRAQVDELPPELDPSLLSPPMVQLYERVARVALHDVPVLLRGENGTGKSRLAKRLHQLSGRRARPFVVVHCPTLTEELLAGELFGHAKGAFTGAVRDQAGRVEAAEGGTLLLDEIAELPPSLQAKLLRFVQDKEFERIGESQTRRADVRIIAATNRALDAEVAAGRFREDLYYRLNTVELTVPPLRDRRSEIVPMARRFLAHSGRALRPAPEFTPEAEAVLLAYEWPGNVRELRNAVEHAVILSASFRLGPEALPERIVAHASHAPQLGGDFTLEAIEREHLVRVVERSGTMEEAARILGVDLSTIWRKRKKMESG